MFEISSPSVVMLGQMICWQIVPPDDSYEYAWWVYLGKELICRSDSSPSHEFLWRPVQTGDYRAMLFAENSECRVNQLSDTVHVLAPVFHCVSPPSAYRLKVVHQYE